MSNIKEYLHDKYIHDSVTEGISKDDDILYDILKKENEPEQQYMPGKPIRNVIRARIIHDKD